MDSVKKSSYDSVEFMLKHMQKRQERVEKARKDLNLRDQDVLHLIDIPQGQSSRIKSGTFSYKKLTSKANRLQLDVSSLKSQIAKVESSALSKEERAKRRSNLQCRLAYTKTKLSSEVEKSPRVYVSAQVEC